MWQRPKKILVVEDEDLVRRLLCKFLVREGHDVHEASGIEDALPIFEASMPYDALICDVHLGGDSGWSVAEKIRALQPSISVLMLTGLIHKIPPPLGFRHVIMDKPFSPAALKKALGKLW